MGAVDSRRHRPAHAHALCTEGGLAVTLCVRLHCGRRVGARHPTDHLLLYLETDRGYGPPADDVGTGRRRHLYLEPLESRQQPEHHYYPGRCQLRVVLLLFLRRTYGARQGRGPDRNPLPDDRVRRGLRLHSDGPHVALDWAIDRPHRIHRSLLWPAESLALGFDHPHLSGDGPTVQQ